MVEPAEKRADLEPESTTDVERRIWDLALNLVHPALFYVVFQLVILDHFGRSPALAGKGPFEPSSLGLYTMQFLGAWTVFYTTLLRDMGYRIPWGTVLLLTALASVIAQYFVIPDPSVATADAAWVFLGIQMTLAGVGWPLTMIRWLRLKRGWIDEAARVAEDGRP